MDNHYEDDYDYEEDQKQLQQQQNGSNTLNQHLTNRKILPLPKPRWKRTNITNSKQDNTPRTLPLPPPTPPPPAPSTLDSFASSSSCSNLTNDNRDTAKKMKWSGDSTVEEVKQVDNKRKERNWKDNFVTTAEITEVNNTMDPKKFGIRVINSNDHGKTRPIKKPVALKATPPSPPTQSLVPAPAPAPAPAPPTPAPTPVPVPAAAATKKSKKKKGKLPLNSESSSSTTYTKLSKKKTKSKKKVKEEIAPGGFLSSDITLFENPISDDWICLFCQYDILNLGLEDAKRKNGYYRRKKERNRRLKEAEMRRLGSYSESDDENTNDHHHLHHQSA